MFQYYVFGFVVHQDLSSKSHEESNKGAIEGANEATHEESFEGAIEGANEATHDEIRVE